jgi:hypothetical protein
LAAPLNKYLTGEQPETFDLDETALSSHAALKMAVTTAPVLALPRKEGRYIVEADASASQLGAQLLQEQEDGSYRPLGYWSRQCNAAERNYSPTEREALAIVWAVKLCRPYLERTKFLVRSDHQALRWLFGTTSTDGNPRIVRWKLALSAFDFTVEYRPGASQRVADELSRMETSGLSPTHDEPDDEVPCLVVEATTPEDYESLSPPVIPRGGPIVHVPKSLDSIGLDEMLAAQAQDL